MPFATYFWAFVFVAAGINHFIMPGFYVKAMPYWFPAKQFWVSLSGIIEVILGLMLLVKSLNQVVRLALLTMLGVFMVVHLWHIYKPPVPQYWWAFWARALGQFAIMYGVWKAGD